MAHIFAQDSNFKPARKSLHSNTYCDLQIKLYNPNQAMLLKFKAKITLILINLLLLANYDTTSSSSYNANLTEKNCNLKNKKEKYENN